MTILRMAWRNVFRQKRRTVITLSALIVGLAGFVVFQGYIGSFMAMYREQTIRSGTGHLQIAKDWGYWGDGAFNPFRYVMPDETRKIAALETDPDALAVFPSTGFTSVAAFGDKTVTLLVKGYPPERMYFASAPGAEPPEDRFTLGSLEAGTAPEPGERDGIVIGETAARILGVTVGDVVTLMAMLPDGGTAGRDFTVRVIYGSPGTDRNFAFTDFETAKDFIGVENGSVIHVIASDTGRTGAMASRLAKGTAYRTWKDLSPFWVGANTILTGYQNVIRGIILLVTLFIAANLTNRVVFERTRELGTLRAFGTKKKSILLLVVLEGCFQGFSGAALGMAAGFGASAVINLAGGLPFSFNDQEFTVRVGTDPFAVLANIVPVVLIAGLAAFLPGLRAVRLSPAECLSRR